MTPTVKASGSASTVIVSPKLTAASLSSSFPTYSLYLTASLSPPPFLRLVIQSPPSNKKACASSTPTPTARSNVSSSSVAAVKDALSSENKWLWSFDINTKEERSTGFFAPHQDATYAGLSPSYQCLTAWLALSDPFGVNEGCFSSYPESHRLGQFSHCIERTTITC